DAGIEGVTGRLLGDESRYDTERYNPSWPERYITQNNTGPLTALSVDDGFSQFEPAVAAPNPAAWAATALSSELSSLGIATGGTGNGTAPPEAVVVATVESLPLSEIISEMLGESDNNTAELLTKEAGTLDGDIGRTADGLMVARAEIGELEADISQVVLVDGSGLDPNNLVTCELLVNVLLASGRDSSLAQGLAVVGETGTLAHRFPDTPLAGNLRAKTGFINTVTGLAGFIQTPGGEELVFALISNDLSVAGTEGFDLQEQVGLRLYGSPAAPDTSDLAP
ncbi:MAG: D-alanyl-D-alanine carboxypeptidase/D-alanyl-D-alanine-endopeptidase, partial [Acidimicrobiales bacterium]